VQGGAAAGALEGSSEMFLSRRQPPPPGSGLHQCPICHGDFVIPLWWEELEDERLHLLLRCGECETHRDVVVPGDVADRYEREYIRVLEAMGAVLKRLDRERMTAEASAFSTALARDLIDAGDFGAR
jgi:hypothetical protein